MEAEKDKIISTQNVVKELKKEVKKKMVSLSFTGKELLENKVFDTTSENVAKANNIFNPKMKYVPYSIILGEKEFLPLIEKEVEKMSEGEERIVKLSVKDSFGERKADLVRVVPLKVFIDQKIKPVPGLVVGVGDYTGKVQSVSGGRVRVDFNNPLAGREIEYKVKLEKEFKDKKEIAGEFFKKYYAYIPGAKREIKENVLYITLSAVEIKNLKNVNNTIQKLADSFGIKIEFKEAPIEKKAEVKKEETPKVEKEEPAKKEEKKEEDKDMFY